MQTLPESTAAPHDPLSLRAVSLAGTFAALSAAFLVCRVPSASPKTLTITTILWLACKYVGSTAITGMAATWIYFHRSTHQPALVFRTLARSLSVAWLLFPAFVLFLWEGSPALLLITPLAAVGILFTLERFLPQTPEPAAPLHDLFAEQPPLPQRGQTVFAALALTAALALAANASYTAGAFCLAAAALLIAARWSGLTRAAAQESKERSPVLRIGVGVIVSLLLTLVALLPWMKTSRWTPEFLAGPIPHAKNPYAARHTAPMLDADGWHAIVLWPFPPKKEKLPPIPHLSLAAANFSRPLVIPFNGSYRYFQTPGFWRPEHAHTAHGSPLAVDIHSVNAAPLFEEAYQLLGQPIDTNCCRAIEVTIRNGDNSRGGMILGLVLRDSTIPEAPATPPFAPHAVYEVSRPDSPVSELSLTPQPVMTSFHAGFTMKSEPVSETLTFTLPPQPRLRRFDEISVVFLPEPSRAEAGAKMAVQQFQLIPR